MVHDLNKAEAEKNRNFVNLHKENRKRRYDDISKFSLSSRNDQMSSSNLSNNIGGSNNLNNQNYNPFGQQVSTQANASPSQNFIFNRRKILLSNLVAAYCTDEEIEKIINDLTPMNREQAKDYLKKTISQLISKKENFYILFNFF